MSIWGTLPNFTKFLEEWKFGLWCYGQNESRTSYPSTWGSLYRTIFLSMHLACTF